MVRIANVSSGAFAGAAALALSVAAIAHAQQAQPSSQPATVAQIATSPAAKRLKELLEVVNSGDAAAMKAYVQANGVQAKMCSELLSAVHSCKEVDRLAEAVSEADTMLRSEEII